MHIEPRPSSSSGSSKNIPTTARSSKSESHSYLVINYKNKTIEKTDKKGLAASAKEIHQFLLNNKDQLSLEQLKLISKHSKSVLSEKRLLQKKISTLALFEKLSPNIQHGIANRIQLAKNIFNRLGAHGFEATTHNKILDVVIPAAGMEEKFKSHLERLRIENTKLAKLVEGSKAGIVDRKELIIAKKHLNELIRNIKNDFFIESPTDTATEKKEKARLRTNYSEVLSTLEWIKSFGKVQANAQAEIQTFKKESVEPLKAERRVKAETNLEDRTQTTLDEKGKIRSLFKPREGAPSVRSSVKGPLPEVDATGKIKKPLPFDRNTVTLNELAKMENPKIEYLQYALPQHMFKEIYKANQMDPGFKNINASFVADKLADFLQDRKGPIGSLEDLKEEFKIYLTDRMKQQPIQMDAQMFREMAVLKQKEGGYTANPPDELRYAPEYERNLTELKLRQWTTGERTITLTPMDNRKGAIDPKADALKAVDLLFSDPDLQTFLRKI